MRATTTLLFIIISCQLMGQEISGTMMNEYKETVKLGAILVKQNGVLKDVVCTDFYGNYATKPLDPGNYDIIAFYNCYDTVTITNVPVLKGENTLQNITLNSSGTLPRNTIRPYKKQLTEEMSNHEPNPAKVMIAMEITICTIGASIDMDVDNPTSFRLIREEITRLPY